METDTTISDSISTAEKWLSEQPVDWTPSDGITQIASLAALIASANVAGYRRGIEDAARVADKRAIPFGPGEEEEAAEIARLIRAIIL